MPLFKSAKKRVEEIEHRLEQLKRLKEKQGSSLSVSDSLLTDEDIAQEEAELRKELGRL